MIAKQNSEGKEVFEFNVLRNTVEDFDDEEQTSLPRQWNNFEDCFHRSQNICVHDEEEARDNLRRQHHIDDIVFRDFVEVCIDFRMMGIAGFDSWGDKPLYEVTLPSENNYSYGFEIVPFDDREEIEEKLKYEYE